jgi:CRP-like cAMP-binding protein
VLQAARASTPTLTASLAAGEHRVEGPERGMPMNASKLPTVDDLALFLAKNPVCRTLSPSEVAEIIFALQVDTVGPGTRVVCEGEVGDAWYLIYSGECTIDRQEQKLATLGPGDFFGELSVLDGAPRSASVASRSAAILLRFPARAFEQLLAAGSLAAHKVVLEMTRALARRMRGLLDEASCVAIDSQPGGVLVTRPTP